VRRRSLWVSWRAARAAHKVLDRPRTSALRMASACERSGSAQNSKGRSKRA
jgi:hypothetical protein